MLMKSKKNVLPPRTSDVELETTTSWIHKVLKEMATTTLHLVKSVIDDYYYPRLYLKIRLSLILEFVLTWSHSPRSLGVLSSWEN